MISVVLEAKWKNAYNKQQLKFRLKALRHDRVNGKIDDKELVRNARNLHAIYRAIDRKDKTGEMKPIKY